MNITIKILDVGDADAIIVILKKRNKQICLLIDAGRSRDKDKVANELNKHLRKLKSSDLFIVINTHFDSDHIGGLSSILSKYKNHIDFLLMLPYKVKAKKKVTKSGAGVMPGLSSRTYGTNDGYKALEVYQSIAEHNNLLKQAQKLGINTRKPYSGYSIKGWPEIEFLGPSKKLFKKYFPLSKIEGITYEAKAKENPKVNAKNCFQVLDAADKSVSAVNVCSVILGIQMDKKKFLLAADAGVKSFSGMESNKYKKGLFWLKVPHHGSIKNLTSDLIKSMNPKYAFISGDKSISKALTLSLEKVGADIQTTSINGDLEFTLN